MLGRENYALSEIAGVELARGREGRGLAEWLGSPPAAIMTQDNSPGSDFASASYIHDSTYLGELQKLNK